MLLPRNVEVMPALVVRVTQVQAVGCTLDRAAGSMQGKGVGFMRVRAAEGTRDRLGERMPSPCITGAKGPAWTRQNCPP
jgi:hypothetical protein